MSSPWPLRMPFDVIFCRNVMIYFDRETQRTLYGRFARQLARDGYFVAGHSENLHWVSDVFRSVGETVYQKARGAADRRSLAPAENDVALLSGQVFASASPTVLRTVLGSCVAVCLFDPQARVGGMNHFMLPDGPPGDPRRLFGAQAMSALLDKVMSLGGQRERLRAKLFGGVNALRGATTAISEANVAFAKTFLRDAGVPVVAERVGGEDAMVLYFKTHSGRAFLKTVQGREVDDTSSAAAGKG